MINNYLQEDCYKPWHRVYFDQSTNSALYLGDVSSALDKNFILTENIRTVVTVAADMNHVSFQNDIHHVVYPIYDSKSENINQLFLSFIEIVEKQLLKGNILVHCFAGISRPATLIIAYLMKKCDFTFREAIQFVRKQRTNVCPNYGFEMQLKQFEKSLKNQSNLKITRRKNSKTSQSNKHQRIANTQLELPQISVSLLRKTHLKTKIVNPSKFFAPERRIPKISRQNDQFNAYQPQRTTHRPVLKPRSLSHVEKRTIGLQSHQSKRIQKPNFKFTPLVKPNNKISQQKKQPSITQRRMNYKIGKKLTHLYPI